MASNHHYKLQTELSASDSQQQAVMGQALPNQQQQQYYQQQAYQGNYSLPAVNQVNIPVNQAYQQPAMQQPQYVFIPQGVVQQGQQVNSAQMSQMMQMPYPPNMVHPTSRYSQTLNCRNCKRPVETVTHYEAGNGAYVIGGMMAAVGLWIGCCLIPCLMNDCKDSVHYCPNCGTQLGRKKFLFE